MAKIFRLQQNTPEAYVNPSRDFQMMCNTFDIMNGGVRFDIDSIQYQNDTLFTRESMLTYLQHKLVFYTNINISSNDLRTVLRAFPELVKLKGSRVGIEKSIYLYLHMLRSSGNISINIVNEPEDVYNPGYVVIITIEHQLSNIDILDAILKYIIPSGYSIEYYFESRLTTPHDPVVEKDKIKVYFVEDRAGDIIAPLKDNEPIRVANIAGTTIPAWVEDYNPDTDGIVTWNTDSWKNKKVEAGSEDES